MTLRIYKNQKLMTKSMIPIVQIMNKCRDKSDAQEIFDLACDAFKLTYLHLGIIINFLNMCHIHQTLMQWQSMLFPWHGLVLTHIFSPFQSLGIDTSEDNAGPGNTDSCSASVSYSTMVCDAASNDLSSAISVTKTRALSDITKQGGER